MDDDTKVTEGADVSKAAEVVEGEIVGDDKEGKGKEAGLGKDTGSKEGESDVQTVMNLENMIRTNNAQIAKLSEELSEAREMLKDTFEGDITYREHADAAKEANKVKNATKAQILKKPDVAQIATNVKVLTSELKELKQALSDYLREFNRLSGMTEIEGDNGELLEIVYVAKLVKKRI